MNVAQKILMLAVTALLLAGCEKPIPPFLNPLPKTAQMGT